MIFHREGMERHVNNNVNKTYFFILRVKGLQQKLVYNFGVNVSVPTGIFNE